MRKLVLFFVLFGFACPAGAITNGGFESGTTGWDWWGASRWLYFSMLEHSGDGVAEIAVLNYGEVMQSETGVSAGETWRAEGWVRVPSGGPATFGWFDYFGYPASGGTTQTSASSWTKLSVEYAHSSSTYSYIGVKGTGQILFDDASTLLVSSGPTDTPTPSGPTPTPTDTPSPTPVSIHPYIEVSGTFKDGVYDSTRNCLYLSNFTDNRVDIVDIAARSMDGSVSLSNPPYGLDLTVDNSKLYVANGEVVTVIDTASRTVDEDINTDPVEEGVFYDFTPMNVSVGVNYAFVGHLDQWGYIGLIDLSDNSITRLDPSTPGSIYPTVQGESFDKQYIVLAETGISSTDVIIYNSVTALEVDNTSIGSYSYHAAANHDGSFFLVDTDVLDSNLDVYDSYPYYLRDPIFLKNFERILVSMYGISHSFPYTSIRFYDYTNGVCVAAIDGTSDGESSDGTFLLCNSLGTELYMVGHGKIYFVPVPSLSSGLANKCWESYD